MNPLFSLPTPPKKYNPATINCQEIITSFSALQKTKVAYINMNWYSHGCQRFWSRQHDNNSASNKTIIVFLPGETNNNSIHPIEMTKRVLCRIAGNPDSISCTGTKGKNRSENQSL